MSKMFDYISGKREGREAELEASLEHALGHLGGEIEESAKLRAENERLRTKLQVIHEISQDHLAPARQVIENIAATAASALRDALTGLR
jgi:regulator of replication initiation timing